MAGLLSIACLALAGLAVSAQASTTPAQASTLPTLTLTLTSSSLTVGGSPQSGAVNVVSTANGVKGEPSVILFLLKPGVTVAEAEAAQKSGGGKDPNRLAKYGSIVFDTEVEPGKTSEVQTYLQPGQYAALVPSEGKGPKAKALFTVSASKAPVALPKPAATIRSIEFGFTGPTTLHDGELVGFENEGFLVHMDIAARVKNLKTAKKLVKALLAGDEKAVRKLSIGGVGFQGPVSTGGYQQETISAPPGVYVQLCFMETQDHRDHTRLGMERIIKIVK